MSKDFIIAFLVSLFAGFVAGKIGDIADDIHKLSQEVREICRIIREKETK